MKDKKQEQTGPETGWEQPEEAAPEAASAPEFPDYAEEAPPDARSGAAKSGGAVRKTRILFGVLALIVLALLTIVVFRVLDGGQPLSPENTPLPMATDDPNRSDQPAVSETPEPTPTMDPGVEPELDMDADRKEGVYTILIAGLDRASNSTDTIVIGTFDTVKHKITVTNIPRDTLINIGWSTSPKKINVVYPAAVNSGEDPAARLKQEARKLLGFEVDFYAIVNIQAIEQAVDAVGGVWYDVPPGMVYCDFVQDLYIDIPEGYQLLTGQQAVQICRFRSGYAGGDLQRIEVQHGMLQAIAEQVLSAGSIPNIPLLLDILSRDVQTDLSADNVLWFAMQFLSVDPNDITFQTMPYGGGPINGISFVCPQQDAWLKMINESINPYQEDVRLQNLNLLMGSGSNVYASTGYILGGINSFYCQSCTSAAGRTVAHAPGVHTYGYQGSGLSAQGTASQQWQSAAPTQTAVPAQTATPTPAQTQAQPETPTQAETPTEPEAPAQAGTPAQPETPTQAETPAQPETPTQPETPAQPETRKPTLA
ncbi:MAG: LCP family protein [Oscillospiraceae bacterium]|nr:LCP family protein [Oscillospiraceae bacterium]